MAMAAWLVLLPSLAGCGGPGTGGLQVFVVPEDSITTGVDSGTDPSSIQDGWTARYSRFLVVIGNLRAWRSADPTDRIDDPRSYVIDLFAAGQNGVVLNSFTGLTASRWDKVGYDLLPPDASTVVTDAATAGDLALMMQGGYSVYFEGTITKSDGQHCDPTDPTMCVPDPKVSFKWGFPIATAFDDCGSSDTDLGFAVPSGGTAAIKPTIHGDHIFFNAIPHGSVEPQKRLAQWMANADLDANGELTIDELKQSRASDLFPPADYDLSGSPVLPIVNGYDVVNAQLRGIGHFNGDGDCSTRTVLK
jgi:hypothetical protein